MNVRRAATYVLEQGDALARARMRALTEGERPPADVVAELEPRQSASGAWPAGMEAGAPDSLGQTCTVLMALQDLGLQNHPLALRGVEYLLSRQEEDGGWWEREDGADWSWTRRGEEAGRLYLTAWISSLLVVHGRAESAQATAALDFLLNAQQEDGTFVGFPRYTAWFALPLLATRLGKRSGPAQNILRTFSQQLGGEGWSSAQFAAMLRSLLTAGFGLETPLVRTAWEQLLMRQNEEGFWDSEEGEGDRVRTTLEVLWCWRRITVKA